MAHENLDVYRLALEVARWLPAQRFPRGLADLKTQGVRSSCSVVLNIAEGWRRRGRAGTNHLNIARSSAAETLAVLDIAQLPGSGPYADRLRRVARMLERMGG